MKNQKSNKEQELCYFDVDIKKFSLKSPEERAYAVIKQFFIMQRKKHKNDEIVEDRNIIHQRFISWLIEPYNREAKSAALERVFSEMLDEAY